MASEGTLSDAESKEIVRRQASTTSDYDAGVTSPPLLYFVARSSAIEGFSICAGTTGIQKQGIHWKICSLSISLARSETDHVAIRV